MVQEAKKFLFVWKTSIEKSFKLGLILCLITLSNSTKAQQAEMMKLDKFLGMIEAPSSKIKVINFWATWCAPCIKEIPFFEKVNRERQDVKITLVSMDIDQDPNPDKIYKFIARKKLASEILILDEKNPRSWIAKIDKKWSGNLPVTLLVNTNNGKRKFVERQLNEGELEKLIDEMK